MHLTKVLLIFRRSTDSTFFEVLQVFVLIEAFCNGGY
jgi:hypothetical protein